MIEGDAARWYRGYSPNLKSVSDLAQYWELFKDPSNPPKGVLSTPGRMGSYYYQYRKTD
jgi:hypothetical protein